MFFRGHCAGYQSSLIVAILALLVGCSSSSGSSSSDEDNGTDTVGQDGPELDQRAQEDGAADRAEHPDNRGDTAIPDTVSPDTGIADSETTEDSDSADVPALPPPSVQEMATYEITTTTETYGQGLSHSEWGGGTTESVDLVLDVYEPTDAPGRRPAMVVIHGGGFTGGRRTQGQIRGFAEAFASRGWVSFSIDYRVAGDKGTVPAEWLEYVDGLDLESRSREQALAMYPSARDAKAAIRWLYANAETYQIDTDYISVIGGSAGSFLAIMLGVTEGTDYRDEVSLEDDPTLSSTHLDQPAQIHTIIDHWGGVTHIEALELVWGLERFDTTDAPVSIVHGTEDPTVLFSHAERLRDAYTETGVAFDFHPLEGAGHGPWRAEVDGLSLVDLALAFVIEQQGLTTVE